MEKKPILLFVLFVASSALVSYTIHDLLSFLFSSYSLLPTIIVLAIIGAIAVLNTIKLKKFDLFSFLQKSYIVIFSLAVASLVYIAAAWSLVFMDQFLSTTFLIFSSIFPALLALVFSVYYFSGKFLGREIQTHKVVIKSISISVGFSIVALIAVGLVGSYLFYTSTNLTSDNAKLIECGYLAENACRLCLTSTGNYEACEPQRYLQSEENLRCSLSSLDIQLKSDGNIKCDSYLAQDLSFENLQVYNDALEIESIKLRSLENIKDATESFTGDWYYDIGVIWDCILDTCYNRIDNLILDNIRLGIISYEDATTKANIFLEYENIKSGFQNKTKLDETLESLYAENKDVILFNPFLDTMDSYIETVKPRVEEYFSNLQTSTNFFESIQRPSDLRRILAGGPTDGGLGALLISDPSQPGFSATQNLLYTTSLFSGIGRLFRESSDLYSFFTKGGNSGLVLFENRNVDESLESKYIRYKLLYEISLENSS